MGARSHRVKEAIQRHFESVFSEPWGNRPTPASIDFKQVSLAENSMLISTFSEEEIKEAVNSCDNYKSPGPDGYNFKFLKCFWDLIKSDFCNFLNEFHSNGRLVKGRNSSFLALITKKSCPQNLKYYRPISMIGCMYKVLSKLLAARLAKVLQKLISPTQSTFLPNRNITESVLIAKELVDDVKRIGSRCIIFKADVEKAFDSVSWNFLFFMMRKMGISEIWIGWIRECLSSTRIAALVNGSSTNEITMHRGLWQGDPLSPLLFLIAVEGLNGIVERAKERGLFKGVEVGKEKIEITNLQYADDTLLVGVASNETILAMKSIMRMFELISGLKINFTKSSLIGVNTNVEWLESKAAHLGCKTGEIPFMYLGLPVGANPRLSNIDAVKSPHPETVVATAELPSSPAIS